MANSVTAPTTTTASANQGTLSFSGLATGIDTTSLVEKLIQVESRPQILKQAEQTRLQNQLATWQELNSKLLSVSVAAGDLSRLTTWNSQNVSSSNESVLTARASLDAPTGTYTVSVEKLAKAHQVATQAYDSTSADVGAGDLNIQVGDGATHTITLGANNNTLTGVAKAINAAKIGVTASVVSTGGQYKLLLASNATGKANAITVTQDAGVNLSFDFDNPVQAADDAQLKLGSGAGAIVAESASNTVDTLLKGISIDLKSASPGAEIQISISRDSQGIGEKVQTFVDAYNDAMADIAKQFTYDADTNIAGILMGDSALMAVQRSLNSLVTATVASGSDYRALSSVGVRIGDGGQLSFDSSKLSAAMDADFDGVMRLFRTGGTSTNASISFVYASSKTKESASGYAVDVTQVATRAAVTGAGPAALAIGEANDTLTLSLDGASPVTVTLTHRADYTAASLAAEIQAKINAAGSGKVSVSADESGALTVTSARYGSASKVSVVGGSAAADLNLTGVPVGTGADVAGTINGEPATGKGQILTGNAGNANTDGLQLLVELDGHAGEASQATVTVTKGVFSRFDEYLSTLTDPLSGTAGLRQSSLNKSIESIGKQIQDMQAQLDAKRQSLFDQFNRMEKAVGELNSQANYLANALSGLGSNWQWNS